MPWTEEDTDILVASQPNLTNPVSHVVAHVSTIKTFLTSSYELHRGEMEYIVTCWERAGDCWWRGMVGKRSWAWLRTMKNVCSRACRFRRVVSQGRTVLPPEMIHCFVSWCDEEWAGRRLQGFIYLFLWPPKSRRWWVGSNGILWQWARRKQKLGLSHLRNLCCISPCFIWSINSVFYLIKQNFLTLERVLAFEKHCSIFACGY